MRNYENINNKNKLRAYNRRDAGKNHTDKDWYGVECEKTGG